MVDPKILHLLTLKLIQICMNLFLLLDTKRGYFLIISLTKQLMGTIEKNWWGKKIQWKSMWVYQLFGYQPSSKYHLLCSFCCGR